MALMLLIAASLALSYGGAIVIERWPRMVPWLLPVFICAGCALPFAFDCFGG